MSTIYLIEFWCPSLPDNVLAPSQPTRSLSLLWQHYSINTFPKQFMWQEEWKKWCPCCSLQGGSTEDQLWIWEDLLGCDHSLPCWVYLDLLQLFCWFKSEWAKEGGLKLGRAVLGYRQCCQHWYSPFLSSTYNFPVLPLIPPPPCPISLAPTSWLLLCWFTSTTVPLGAPDGGCLPFVAAENGVLPFMTTINYAVLQAAGQQAIQLGS